MLKHMLLCLGLAATAYSFGQGKEKLTTPPQPSSDSAKPTTKKGGWPLADKTKGSKKSDGLFTLYQDTATGGVQLYIKKDQLGKEYIYQSFSLNGPTSLFLNQSMHRANFVFKVQKVFDKLEFSRINTSFYYDTAN